MRWLPLARPSSSGESVRSEKLRVLIITSSFPPSRDGTARLMGNVADFLSAGGHSVNVITRRTGRAPLRERMNGVVVLRISSSSSFFGKIAFLLKSSAAIAASARRLRIDVIHAAGTAALASSVLGSLNSLPILVTFPGLPAESIRSGDPQRIVKSRARAILRILALFPSSVTVPTRQVVDPVVELCGEQVIGKVRVVPNPIDVNKFSPSGRVMAKENFPEVLVVGGLRSRKGVGTLFQALPKVLSKYPALRVTLVGGGSFGPALKGLVEKLGIGSSVRWTGEVSDEQLVGHYEESDIVVVPSLAGGEAFGYVVAEAMCMKKPVVASATPGPMGIISDATCGLLFPPGDSDALAARIIELSGDEKRRALLGENGRRYAEEHFDSQKVMARFEGLYDAATGRVPKREHAG